MTLDPNIIFSDIEVQPKDNDNTELTVTVKLASTRWDYPAADGLDFVVIIDGSVGQKSFDYQVDFVRRLQRNVQESADTGRVRMALILSCRTNSVVYRFSDPQGLQSVTDYLAVLPYPQPRSADAGYVDLYGALERSVEMFERSSTPGRGRAIVLVTPRVDSSPNDIDDLRPLLDAASVSVKVVAAGNVNPAAFNGIVEDPATDITHPPTFQAADMSASVVAFRDWMKAALITATLRLTVPTDYSVGEITTSRPWMPDGDNAKHTFDPNTGALEWIIPLLDRRMSTLTLALSWSGAGLPADQAVLTQLALSCDVPTLDPTNPQETLEGELPDAYVGAVLPAIEPEVIGDLSPNGWYVSDVTVRWNASGEFDQRSGIREVRVLEDTAGQWVSSEAGSVLGASQAQVHIQRDTTPPTISVSGVSTTPYVRGRDHIRIVTTATDEISGVQDTSDLDIDSPASDFDLGNHKFEVWATDMAGNRSQETIEFDVVDPDGTAENPLAASFAIGSDPQPWEYEAIRGVLSGKRGNNGWFIGNVTINWQLYDKRDGSIINPNMGTYVRREEGNYVRAMAKLWKRNGVIIGRIVGRVRIKLDKTRPVVYFVGNAGTYIHGQNIKISSYARDSISGLAHTRLPKIDAPASRYRPGRYTLRAVAIDNAGLRTVRYTSFRVIDVTPPTITPHLVGVLGNNGWYVSPVTVSWTVSDPQSQIISSSGCGTRTIETDTTGMTLTCSATSAGGTASRSVSFKIDQHPPVITFSGQKPSYRLDEMVEIMSSASDETSGVASEHVPSVSGAAWEFAPGINEITATATDNAGNVATQTLTFEIIVDAEGVCGLMAEWLTGPGGHGIAKSLCKKLHHENYDGFIDFVTKMTGKKVPVEYSAILIRLARYLQANSASE